MATVGVKTCECGCGEPVKGRFVHGHNTRVANPMWDEKRRAAQAQRMRDNNPMDDPAVRKKISESNRRREWKCGEEHHHWAGEHLEGPNGYVYEWAPDHPHASRGRYKNRVPEHVLVAEKVLGRHLDRDNEIVHHINFDGGDNRPENLLVCSRAYHTWLHHKIRRRGLEDYFRGL